MLKPTSTPQFKIHLSSETPYIIKISLHNMHITRDGLQVVVRLFGTQVTCAYHVLDLARDLYDTLHGEVQHKW